MEEALIPIAAGVIASGITEALNRLTPTTKIPPRVLQGVAFSAAAAGVVGWKLYHAQPIDWNLVVPQVIGAWGFAIGTHDVLSPREKEVQP